MTTTTDYTVSGAYDALVRAALDADVRASRSPGILAAPHVRAGARFRELATLLLDAARRPADADGSTYGAWRAGAGMEPDTTVHAVRVYPTRAEVDAPARADVARVHATSCRVALVTLTDGTAVLAYTAPAAGAR